MTAWSLRNTPLLKYQHFRLFRKLSSHLILHRQATQAFGVQRKGSWFERGLKSRSLHSMEDHVAVCAINDLKKAAGTFFDDFILDRAAETNTPVGASFLVAIIRDLDPEPTCHEDLSGEYACRSMWCMVFYDSGV